MIAVFLFGTGFVSAAACDLRVSLLNQDPYPAIPGDYVKVVFQVTGIENPECGKVDFGIKEAFPFSLDEGARNNVQIIGGNYVPNYKNYLMIPYQLRVDDNALEGDNEIETVFHFNNGGEKGLTQTKNFDINVEDSRTDFEASVKNFDANTNIITFEIINIGESDVEAVTVDVPVQDNFAVKGSSRNIVGSLDSNEDTTFTFEAEPSDGEIQLKILYTDALGIRRSQDKTVEYHSEYFVNRKADQVDPKPTSYYVAIVLIIFIILSWIRGYFKRRRKNRLEKAKRK